MGIVFKERSPHSVPLGGDAAWASVVVYDDEGTIVPWSIIFSLYLVGSYFVSTKLGDVSLPQNIKLTECTMQVAVMPEFRDLKYTRWSLFDVKVPN